MNSGRPAALLAETEQLAERLLAVAPPPTKPPPAEGGWNFVAKAKFLVDPTALADEMHTYLLSERRLQTFLAAYSVAWFRHGRKVKQAPNHPEFFEYRDLVRRRAIELVSDCDNRLNRVMDKMADGEVLFPLSEPEVTVASLLTLADQRRMDAEQDSTIHLIRGILEQTDKDERVEVGRKLLEVILERWRAQAATTTAFFDALARKD